MLNAIGAILLLVLTGTGGQAAELTFKEGLWEFTLVMEMPGMPIALPPQTFTQCLTQDDCLPTPPEGFQECRPSRMEAKGSQVLWEWVCDTEEGPATLGGEMNYQGEKMKGVIKVRRGPMEVRYNMSGRWLRECVTP